MKCYWWGNNWFALALLVMTTSFMFPVARGEDPADEEHSAVKITHEGGVIALTLRKETQEHIGLKTGEVQAAERQPSVVAFGKLEQDPAGIFALRAPVAGVLHSVESQIWPGLGSHVEGGTKLGFIEPRLTPLEMADVQARWVDALAEIEEAQADLDAARASLEQKRRLNTEQGLVSDRSLEETQARVRNAEARLAGAQKRGELYESLAKGQSQVSSLFPLNTTESGEVVEVSARPGEVVDAGQVLLRTVRANSLLARVFLFTGDTLETSDAPAQLRIPMLGDGVVLGDRLALAPQAGAATGGQGLIYRVENGGSLPLRPGMAVEAHVPAKGEVRHGVVVPRSAVLRHAGLTWVYVQAGDDRFERRSCVLHVPSADGWFVREGVSAGDHVVIEGAQLLLSEELKSQIESEEAAEE